MKVIPCFSSCFAVDSVALEQEVRAPTDGHKVEGLSGLPKRDLSVSRQHRMLISSKIAARMFDGTDVLCSAIKLTPIPGIFFDAKVRSVEYFHLLFDRHEVIFAEGAPTESLYTGSVALKAVSTEARQEILTLFPELESATFTSKAALPVPLGRLQKQLVARHAKHNKPLLESLC